MEIVNLSYKIKSKLILNNINISLGKNKIIGLFGPNGAGKSTLIRCMVGFINRYDGEIKGISKEHISYMPDKMFLYKFMTIKDAIAFFNDAYGNFDKLKAERLIKALNLDLNQKISDCSKGMIEQVHMVLILSRNVQLYVLDEPLAAVDPLTRDFLINMIEKERYVGSSVFISTHLISDVERMFEEVIFIKDGKILLHKSVDELKRKNQKGLEEIFKEELI